MILARRGWAMLMSSMRRIAGTFFLAVVAGGCAGAHSVANPFSSEKPATSAKPPAVFYAGEGALAVLDKPNGSAHAVGRLALNQRVTRTRIENGYALIKSGDLEGWVVNAKLRWRLPVPAKARAAKPSGPQASLPAAAPAVSEDTAVDPAAAEQVEPEAAEPVQPAAAGPLEPDAAESAIPDRRCRDRARW